MVRYVLFAKLHTDSYYLLRFDRTEIIDVLREFPTTKGINSLVEWPLETHAEMGFFLEMLLKNVDYYYLKDLKTEKKQFVKM